MEECVNEGAVGRGQRGSLPCWELGPCVNERAVIPLASPSPTGHCTVAERRLGPHTCIPIVPCEQLSQEVLS